MSGLVRQPCCDQWAKAHEPATDWEMYGACVKNFHDGPKISGDCDSVKFCPWCGAPKGVPTPELTGTVPLVLYFGTEADRQELIEALRQAKPGMITKHL